MRSVAAHAPAARSVDLEPGTRLVHRRSGTVVTVVRRKIANGPGYFSPGWWNSDGSGLADRVADEDWVPVPALSPSDLQASMHEESLRRWPDMDAESEALALAEEAGEVCRAVLKRGRGIRGSSEEWTDNLRTEITQTAAVLCNLAAIEGFDLFEAMLEEHCRWRASTP